MTKTKIYCVGSFMNGAGAQEALVRVSKQLRLRNHNTQVRFLYTVNSAFNDLEYVSAISPRAKLSLAGYARVFAVLLGELRREKPSAVICFMPLGAVMGCLAAMLAGVRVRVASQRSPGPTFGAAMRFLDKIFGTLPIYTQIVCVSHAVRRSFAGYPQSYRRKLSVVQNGIEWEPPQVCRANVRKRFGLPQDQVLFLAVGRLAPQKNVPFLIDRVAETPAVHLVLAGDGELREQIEAQVRERGISERVHMLGYVPHSDVLQLLAAVDAFVMPTLFEGMSNATLEAMHAGLPILSSDIDTQSELLRPCEGEDVGILIDLADHKRWVDALTLLNTSPAERERLGARAKHHVETNFSLEAMIDGFEARSGSR